MKHERLEGQAKMLLIFIDEADYWENDLLYEAIVKRLHMLDIAGATVSRGLMGYGGPTRLHHLDRAGHPSERPIIISIVDSEEKIRNVLPVLDEMVGEGLIVLSNVEIIKYTLP